MEQSSDLGLRPQASGFHRSRLDPIAPSFWMATHKPSASRLHLATEFHSSTRKTDDVPTGEVALQDAGEARGSQLVTD